MSKDNLGMGDFAQGELVTKENTIYIKRIIKIEIPTNSPEEMIKLAKENKFDEKIISDTFLVEDSEGLIVAKEKVIYVGEGKEFTFGKVL